MKRHLVYGKDVHNVPVLNKSESNTETIDQEFYKVPIIESTKTNEREHKTSTTYAKKFRPFSIQLYNEILHRNICTTSIEQTETQVERSRFKLPLSKQYDPENLSWKHEEEAIVKGVIPNKEINDQETINNGSKAHEYLIINKEGNIKDLKRTARKIVIENLEKVVSKRKEIKKDNTELNTENGRHIVKWQNDSQPSLMIKELKQENISNEKLLDETSDVSKSVKDTVHIYDSIDTELEIKKEIKDERKLFLLQEIEESIEEGSVKKKSTIFENKNQTTVKGRQLEMTGARNAFCIGSETILRIKRLAESRLSNFLLKIFYLHLTNLLIKLTRYISYKQLITSRMEGHLKTKLTNDEESIKKRRLSSADIVQLVSGKSKDLTEKMDIVISEFHSKLHMNKNGRDYERRAKSVSRVDETKTKTYEWLSELDVEEREQIKEEIKQATLAAARRMLGRRRSYHNLTDIENRKVDGLTYIAIVESHVYTNKNAIFDDYVSRLKTQVNNVLEITDVNEMIAAECIEGKYYKFSNNQGYLRDGYMKNTADFQCKESIDEVQEQRIDYVATVTVEHKQKSVISMEKAQKSLTETAWTTDIEGSKVKEITAKAEDRIEANRIKNLNEIVIPTPIIEEMELTTSINEATSNQINEIFDVQKAFIELTEVKEELPIVNTESTELIKAQARSVETIEELKSALHETKENEIPYAINANTAVVKENKVIAEEIVPVVVEVKDVAKEATAVFDFAEASSLIITELKEQLPTVTIQEELSKAQIFNKECIRQSSEVYNEDIKAIESYNLLEDKGVLNIETEKVIATKELNETKIHEEPIELPKTEIDCIITANSTIEESHYKSALSTSCGLLSEFTTNIDTAVVTEDVEINKEIAITKIETNEFATAQTVAIAMARQTSEVYDEIHNDVEITEIKEELPTIGIVEENYTRPVFFGTDVSRQISTDFNHVDEVIETDSLEEDKAIEVIEIKELVIAQKVNYANFEEVHTTFNQLDIQTFHAKKNEEFASSCIEIQAPTMIEEEATESIVIGELSKALSLHIEICQDVNVPVEEVETIIIDVPSNEKAIIKEEVNMLSTVLSVATALITQVNINIFEANSFDNESMIEEHALHKEEKRDYYFCPSLCTSLCQYLELNLEEYSTLEIDQILEELATISIKEEVFVNALSICTSITDEINTIYIEAAIIAKEDLPEENIEISEEENNYSTAEVKCNEIYEIIELLLEDTDELIIDRFEEELAVIQIQSQVFVNALTIYTTVSSEITTIYIEAELLPEERLQEEKAELSEENKHFFNALITCNDISQDIELILEETNGLIINKLDEEIASIQTEPEIFLTALSIYTSISSDITTNYFETGLLTEEKFEEDNAELFVEENHYFTALKACIEISQYIELLLEECNEFAIEEFGLELAAMSVEPFVLEKSLPLSMSILSQINEELYEANILEIKRIEIEEANVIIEVSKLTLILAICIAAIEEIYKELEECSSYKVDEIKEEIGSYKEEPLVLLRILPLCVSILEDFNISFNSAEVLEITQLRKENADLNIEDKYFVTILCLCTSIVDTVITKLDEVNSFNVQQILEYHALEYLEPQIFSKTLPKCTATVFTLNIPVFEVKLLEDEVFEQMTVSASLETKDYTTAKRSCEAIVQDEVLNKVEKTSLSYEVEEDYANLSYENELSSTYAIRAATSRQLDIKYDFADNYESNLEEGQIINSTIETHHFATAQSINNAKAINECVNLTIDDKESNDFVEEMAVIKIEPKHKNVSIREANVTYDDKANVLVKSRKINNSEVVSEIKGKNDTINIAEATIEEKFDNFKSVHIAETNDNKFINEGVIIIEEPVHLTAEETMTVRRKKTMKQKASKDIYLESNIRSNIDVEAVSKRIKNSTDVKSNIVAESIVENLRETCTSISLQQAKENEANVNVSIRTAKAKKIDNQEMSYNLTLTKPQVTDQTVLDTKEETLYVKRKKSLNQYQIEEFEEEFNLSLDQDVESGVIIQEISDSDENNDINEGNQSMDVSLELKLQSETQDESKDVYETTTVVKQRNNDYNSNEESSALTILKKEDVVHTPVVNYEDGLSGIINTYSNDRSEYVGSTEISSESGFESSSTVSVINKKANKRLSKTNEQSHVEMIGNGFKEEIKASKISATENSTEKSIKTSSKTTEFVSDTVLNKSKLLTLKTDLKQEANELSEDRKSNESSPDIESPSKPPTPLTDEYIFRLIAPLPKSRGNTPAPEPSPDVIDKDQYIVNKNLVPTLESVTIERIVYDPPLPTPPTSPVHSTYVKPGLNGGMKRVPRYFKPGLRGGSDRPPIPKEEILEVRKTLSTLTSDINETLKNIEKYKKLVEILKQQKGEGESSKMMEEDEKTDKQTITEDTHKDVSEKETSEQTITEKSIQQPSETEQTKIESNSETDNIVDNKINNEKTDPIKINIKEDITNKIEEARIKSYNITEVTSFEEIEKECDNTGVVELAPDTAEIKSIEKEFSIITEDSEAEKPETNVQIKIEVDKEIEKSEDKVDASDEEQKAADEEVAMVTELTADIIPEISPVDTSPSEADTIKEAHVISLTRVLSSHMLREGLSPDCQKMKDKFENKKNVPEKIEDRSWTTFLQKSTNLQTQKTGHFADLQNKFENQVPFTTKLTDRNELRLSPVTKPRDFNSSPVPWQERVMADNLRASNIKPELTPGEEPKFFLAIPTECKDALKSTVIPLPNTNEEMSNVELSKLNEKGKSEHTVVEIIQDAMNFIENLNIGDGRNRMIQLLLEKIKNIADSNIPIEDQLIQMKKQLEALEKVPDIIKETLDNVAEKIHLLNKTLAMLQLRTIWQSFWQLLNDAVLFCYVDTSCLAEHQKKEDGLQSKEIKYQKELEPKVTITTEIIEEKPQIIKEESKVEKMSAQTKGQLLVNDKKNFASQMKEQFTNKPQQKFGWMKPEPRPIKLFGGRRWRRPGEEYTEEQIAETILAHSELIHGKTMGINFMKYEKPPIPLDHLQHSEVFKMIHNTEKTPQKPVEFRRTLIAEADYRERCRPLSPCPPESSINYKSTF